ncbi:MAG: exodeoxyribonuclease III [Alphaproteobacteria bacterium]|nr:exodeoxyribonuclease III [Alphaproteobacteria bacterium]
MRIATWNINSVRARLPLLQKLAEAEQPDIICLQETKVTDELFPADEVRNLGYPHLAICGMKGYNGVAILSRVPIEANGRRDWCGRNDSRHLSVMLPDGTELHNFYIPAGGDIPDRAANDKFAHKLDFLDEMTAWFPSERRADRPMILVGDLNIAPLETDVWSHKQLLGVVSHTPVEVEKLGALQDTVAWVDAVRHFISPEERLYSWWSYRAKDWSASDRGRRLDHVWVTPPLRQRLAAARVLRAARGWDRASDHVPVVVDVKTG